MTYRYRKSGKYLVREDQGIIEVLRIFVFGYSRHRLDSLGMTRAAARRIAIVAIVRRFRRTKSSSYVTLPVITQLGMRVHRGYKLFNFDRSEVIKLFDDDVAAEQVTYEISTSEKASSVSCAPRFLGSDAGARWFKEEYIRGTHATKLVSASSSDYQRYYADVEKCLLDLANSHPPIPTPLRTHVDRLARVDFRERWLHGGATVDEVERIIDYVTGLHEWLIDSTEADALLLVPTHGDFSLVNAIATNAGLRFIDWEGLSNGGIFSDLFNFAFVEQYYGRTSREFAEELAAMLDRYRDSLEKHCPVLGNDVAISERYARRLYYLERTRFLIERSVTKNLCQVMSKSIAMFTAFETEIGDTQIQ